MRGTKSKRYPEKDVYLLGPLPATSCVAGWTEQRIAELAAEGRTQERLVCDRR